MAGMSRRAETAGRQAVARAFGTLAGVAALVLSVLAVSVPVRAAADSGDGGDGEQRPLLLADIPPVRALLAAVAGPGCRAALALPGISDPHHAQLRPSDMRRITRARLIVGVGGGLVPPLERTAARIAPERWLPLTERDTYPPEEHAWLDPVRMAEWAPLVEAGLRRAGACADEGLAPRRSAARAAILQATRQTAAQLSAADLPPLVTAHAFLEPYARRFGLTVLGALADAEDRPAGAGRLARLAGEVRRAGRACVVVPAGEPSPAAERFAADLDLPLVAVDILGLQAPETAALHAQLHARIARALIEGCRG